MTHTKALGTLIATIVLVVGFALLTKLLGLKEIWPAFLFITVFAMVEDMRMDRLALTVIGAEVGVAIGTMPVWLGPLIGPKVALGLMLLVILLAIYALLKGWVPLLINRATMVFLTAVTIPYVMASARPLNIALGVVVGAVYFGGLAFITSRIGQMRNPTASIRA